MEIDKKAVGARLKDFLKKKFITLEEAGKKLDVPATSLSSNYVIGRSLPGAELLAKLYNYGCDINWLLFGEIKEKDGLGKRINIDGNGMLLVSGDGNATSADNNEIKVNKTGNRDEVLATVQTVLAEVRGVKSEITELKQELRDKQKIIEGLLTLLNK